MKAQGKRFLSERGDEGGNVRWCITEGVMGWHEADLFIGDCFRSINLEFSHNGTGKQVEKRVAKLDNLIEELQKLREALCSSEVKKKPLYY